MGKYNSARGLPGLWLDREAEAVGQTGSVLHPVFRNCSRASQEDSQKIS